MILTKFWDAREELSFQSQTVFTGLDIRRRNLSTVLMPLHLAAPSLMMFVIAFYTVQHMLFCLWARCAFKSLLINWVSANHRRTDSDTQNACLKNETSGGHSHEVLARVLLFYCVYEDLHVFICSPFVLINLLNFCLGWPPPPKKLYIYSRILQTMQEFSQR